MSGPPSLRAAGHALVYWQRRHEVNANNVANVETDGFRAQRVFAEMASGGLPNVGSVTDTRRGDLQRTGGSLDLALEGRGHFVVETPNGQKPVRSGSFALDGEGRIVDADGHALLGSNGPLVLPPGPVEIDARGGVTVDGERIGRLRIVADPVATPVATRPELLDTGQSASVVSPDALEDIPEVEVTVRQGYIEGSNVSALDALVEMTRIQRSFEAVQNSVRAIDSMMETVANRLGRVE